ncbi:MAG: rhodanese-like domain-containing protein [Verrucomicrobiota bacterium]
MMTAQVSPVTARSTMGEVLAAYPGAQRALFRKYHIGGCSSCGFQSTETLAEVCARNQGLDVAEVLAHIRTSHEQDEKIYISATDLAAWRAQEPSPKLLDVRSRQEFEAVHIEGSVLMSHPTMQEIMSKWLRDLGVVLIDHEGRSSLDAAAYFMGHGFSNVRCLRGGIDAWAEQIEPQMPRYQLA